MDEEKEDQPPFRWNPQAVFMLFFFMFAMAIPLAGVVWFARGYLSAQQRIEQPATAAKTVDTTSLEKGLERMSDTQFASTVTVEMKDGVELRVIPDDMSSRIARILEIAKEAGGSGLEMSPSDKGTRRVTIQVPASRYELLKRAIRGESVDFSAIPAGATTQLLGVDLKTP
jgi:hypothetical protein